MSDVRFWSEQLPSERIAAPLDGVFRIECNNLFEFCERPSHQERLLPICSRKAQRNWKDRFSLKTLISKPANISATATVVASATICHFCSRQQVVLTSAFRVANSWVEPFSLGSSKHLGQAACFFRHTSAQNVGVSVTCVWATTAAVFRAEILHCSNETDFGRLGKTSPWWFPECIARFLLVSFQHFKAWWERQRLVRIISARSILSSWKQVVLRRRGTSLC
jgi:hypothetical protein